jgi:hypothetical protein
VAQTSYQIPDDVVNKVFKGAVKKSIISTRLIYQEQEGKKINFTWPIG